MPPYRATVDISIDGTPFKAGDEINPLPGTLHSMLRLRYAEAIPEEPAKKPAKVDAADSPPSGDPPKTPSAPAVSKPEPAAEPVKKAPKA